MKRIVEDAPAAQCGRSIWVLVGDRLRARRARLGLAVESVAEQLGVEPGTYERYEDGIDQAPALLLTEVAEKLGVPVLWFFQDVIAQDVPEQAGAPVRADQAPVYQVATVDERARAMVDRFRKLDFDVERTPDCREVIERELRPVECPAALLQQDAAEANAVLMTWVIRTVDIADGHALGRHGRRQHQHEQRGQKPSHRWPRCVASVRPAPND